MSLWLDPQKKPVKVNLRERFGDYPFFLESFEQYEGVNLPDIVEVTWVPIKDVLETLEASGEDEEAQHDEFIDYVEGIMRAGEDIPPVIIHKGSVFDGRHRSWAADQIGLKKAPAVDITEYWDA